MPTHVSASRRIAVPADAAYRDTIVLPLPELFAHRFLAIPPITAVEDFEGEWGTVGQTRTIVLADGGRLRETLIEASAPDHFGYRLAVLRGPMKALVASVTGRWEFAGDGTSTDVTWRWTITPTVVGHPLMPAFAAMWNRYAATALDRLADRITP